jgi:hypothetical protein
MNPRPNFSNCSENDPTGKKFSSSFFCTSKKWSQVKIGSKYLIALASGFTPFQKLIHGQDEKIRTKIRQMKNNEILPEHSSLGPGVEIHDIY